jgi:uncharacterized membrane protein YdbT with pleckstrin-like domain
MSYIITTLIKGEEVTYQAKLSLWSLLPLLLLGVVLLPMGFGIIFFVMAYLKYISTELAITNKRLIAKVGFISRKTIEINLSKIESLSVEQGIFGRIFNYGTIIVSGSGASHAPISGISNPIDFRKHVLEQTN